MNRNDRNQKFREKRECHEKIPSLLVTGGVDDRDDRLPEGEFWGHLHRGTGSAIYVYRSFLWCAGNDGNRRRVLFFVSKLPVFCRSGEFGSFPALR